MTVPPFLNHDAQPLYYSYYPLSPDEIFSLITTILIPGPHEGQGRGVRHESLADTPTSHYREERLERRPMAPSAKTKNR